MKLGLILFAFLFSISSFANLNADYEENRASEDIQVEGIEEVVLFTAQTLPVNPREFEYRLCVNDCNKSLSGGSQVDSRNACINICGVARQWPGEFYTF